MGRAERDKGKRGEREWANFLTDKGIPSIRGRQFCGTEDSPDVVSNITMPLHCEVKRRQRLNVRKAYEVAASEKAEKAIAYVAHRGDNEEWLVTLSGEDFAFMAAIANAVVDSVKKNLIKVRGKRNADAT